MNLLAPALGSAVRCNYDLSARAYGLLKADQKEAFPLPTDMRVYRMQDDFMKPFAAQGDVLLVKDSRLLNLKQGAGYAIFQINESFILRYFFSNDQQAVYLSCPPDSDLNPTTQDIIADQIEGESYAFYGRVVSVTSDMKDQK